MTVDSVAVKQLPLELETSILQLPTAQTNSRATKCRRRQASMVVGNGCRYRRKRRDNVRRTTTTTMNGIQASTRAGALLRTDSGRYATRQTSPRLCAYSSQAAASTVHSISRSLGGWRTTSPARRCCSWTGKRTVKVHD